MKIKITKTPIKDLLIIDIDFFKDERGFFIEPWNKRDFAEVGLKLAFVQEGHSGSTKDVLRGLHYQDMSAPMGKLVRCTRGTILDVAVDLRVNSSTFGEWQAIELSEDNKRLWFVPPGFANGFLVLSDYAEKQYKQTGYYTPSSEGTISWDDPDINISWPVKKPILSKRDQNGISLKQYLKNPAFK